MLLFHIANWAFTLPSIDKFNFIRAAWSYKRQFRKFWGCTGYPECRHTRNIEWKEPK